MKDNYLKGHVVKKLFVAGEVLHSFYSDEVGAYLFYMNVTNDRNYVCNTTIKGKDKKSLEKNFLKFLNSKTFKQKLGGK